jgi:uncharacterized membrane protein
MKEETLQKKIIRLKNIIKLQKLELEARREEMYKLYRKIENLETDIKLLTFIKSYKHCEEQEQEKE